MRHYTSIGHLEIKNRLVRSSTFEHAATRKGEVPSPKTHWKAYAKERAGLEKLDRCISEGIAL